jgi:hypothetical protein
MLIASINDRRVEAGESQYSCEPGKTPEVKSRTWQWSEIDPRGVWRRKPSRV